MDPENPIDDNDGIIELTRVVKPGQEIDACSKVTAQPLSTRDLTRFDQTDNNLSQLIRDVVEDFPRESVESMAKSTGSKQVPMEKIEAALERVVTRLYSKKIEAMVMGTIEKTVKAEIAKIKEIMKEMADKGPL